MDPLPVIPTPPGQRWREFRIQVLPILVFACTVAAIFYLWRAYVLPPTLVAQVEPVTREIRAQQAGLLTNLLVERFQAVNEGDLIARIIVTDPRQMDARLQMVRSQISLAQLELGTLVDRERLAFDYQNLRSEYMRQQTELSIARAQLPHQEYDVELARALLAENVVSQFEYRRLLSIMEATKARIAQLSTNITHFEQQLETAAPIGALASTTAEELRAALSRLETEREKIESIGVDPIPLRAPISGIVMAIYRRPGENLLEGEPIATITGPNSERMIGYLRQPYAFNPEPGMTVRVRTRSWNRLEAEAQVTGVGAQFEVITNIAFLRPNSTMFEFGLPVSFSIPDELKSVVLGGEQVDVIFQRPLALSLQ